MKRLIHDARGIFSLHTGSVILRIMLVAAALVSTAALIINFVAVDVNTSTLESDMLTYHLLYSTHGLAYFDTVSQSAPLGIIDGEKFLSASKDQSILTKTLAYSDERMAAKITIGSLTAFYNKNLYDDYAVLARTRLPGQASVHQSIRILPVVVRTRSGTRGDTATVEVITPP